MSQIATPIKLFILTEIQAVAKLISIPFKYSSEKTKELGTIKILDSSTIIASLKLFPWPDYKSEIGRTKFHTFITRKVKLTTVNCTTLMF